MGNDTSYLMPSRSGSKEDWQSYHSFKEQCVLMANEGKDIVAGVALGNLLEPIDYEGWIDSKISILKKDPHFDLMLFPEDDVEITTQKRSFRTLELPVPSAALKASRQEVQDVVKLCTQDWSVVNRKYVKEAGSTGTLEQKNNTTQHKYEIDMDNKMDLSPSERSALDQMSENPRSSFASASEDLESDSGDSINKGLLKNYTVTKIKQTDVSNKQGRAQGRQTTLFSLFPNPHTFDLDKAAESRVKPQEPHAHGTAQKIVVKCTSFMFNLMIEPMFASMALYDAKNKKKVSETFHFDMNSDGMLKKYGNNVLAEREVETRSTTAIFSITEPTHDLFIVMRIEKTLQQGELPEAYDTYAVETDNERRQAKATNNAEEFCRRLGNYRMPFLWIPFNLANVIHDRSGVLHKPEDKNGDRSLNFNTQHDSLKSEDGVDSISLHSLPPSMGSISSKFNLAEKAKRKNTMGMSQNNSFERLDNVSDKNRLDLGNFMTKNGVLWRVFRYENEHLADESLYKYMFDMTLKKSSSTLKKLKQIPVDGIHFTIEVASDKHKGVLTSALQKVAPYPSLPKDEFPVREVEEFPVKEVYIPHHTYKNFLYIYPLGLNFSNRVGVSARNIMVRIRILEKEGLANAIKCIYGKSSTQAIKSEATTAVIYHDKCPTFYEEVKVELPPLLTSNHHILFTFHHIVCQNPKPTDTTKSQKEHMIGYTWHPLLDGRREELTLGEHKVPVCADNETIKDYSLVTPKDTSVGQPQIKKGRSDSVSFSVMSTGLPGVNLKVKLPSMTWVDDHKDIFHFKLTTVSSLHMQDDELNNFTKCYYEFLKPVKANTDAGNTEEALKKAVCQIERAKDEPLLKFLYLLLDKLFVLMIKPGVGRQGGALATVVFKALATLTRKVHHIHERSRLHAVGSRNPVLASYLAYIFKIPSDGRGRISSTARTTSLSRTTRDGEDTEDENTPRNSPKASPLSTNRTQSLSIAALKDNSEDCSARSRSSSVVKKVNWRLHEELVLQWVMADAIHRNHAMEHAWFFFEAIIKAMAQHLAKQDQLPPSRKTRFTKSFKEDLELLIQKVAAKIAEMEPLVAGNLNKSLAYFIQDLFSLMDRGFVFRLLKVYWKETAMKGEVEVMKLSLLYVVCQHEHYVQLNLPYPPSLFNTDKDKPLASHQFKAKLCSKDTVQGLSCLNNNYCQQHYLTGLLLAMNSYILNNKTSPRSQRAVVTLTRDILFRHDNDPNYQDFARRSRVASLYLPLVGIVMEVYPKLHKEFKVGSAKEGASETVPTQLEQLVNLTNFSEVNSPTGTLQRTGKQGNIGKTSTRSLLLCTLAVLKNCDDDLLKKWWSTLHEQKITTLISVIKLSVACFEYKGETKQGETAKSLVKDDLKNQLEANMMFGENSATANMRNRKMRGGSTGTPDSGLRWGRTQTSHLSKTKEKNEDILPEDEEDVNESVLCAETSLITLDTLELLVECALSADGHLLSTASKILDVILLMMSSTQSVTVLKHVFSTQRSIITKFSHILFEEDTDQCSTLCYNLLCHCTSLVKEIREEAVASIYLLMRQNFEIVGSFSRVKVQLTIALSRMRTEYKDHFNDTYLRRSLRTLITYADSDNELCNTRFPEQVKDLSHNLFMIMRDTVKMKEVSRQDNDMYIDLMYRIAKGYKNSPALRITWLNNMALELDKNGKYCEAAECKVHAAALISEYMYMVEDRRHLPTGCAPFALISLNVLEESATSDDVLKPNEEGMCTGSDFTERGLVDLLKQAATYFTKANMFESVNEVYNILRPIYEHNRDNKALADMHKEMEEAYTTMSKMGNKRILGTYFRVAFYGDKFEELDKVEMIYKEKPFTKLPEISIRLQKFYEEKFGDDFEFIKDSKKLDPNTLDPFRAYIQVTFVEPYFEPWEEKYRKDSFEFCYNINRFMYSTPFTSQGMARGNVHEQFKRKTILTTELAFPYVKTRIKVINAEEIIMQPIEVATEDMSKKNCQFDEILRPKNNQHDLKMLSMLIQGSIGTTVNQGPVEIIENFLGLPGERAKLAPDMISEDYNRKQNRLRYQCKSFLLNCSHALEINNQYLDPAQQDSAFQREMDENLRKFRDKVGPYIFSTQLIQSQGLRESVNRQSSYNDSTDL